jgi:hypothetical protein
MQQRNANTRIFFTVIVLAYCVYAAFFLMRTSFLVGRERYFTLFDDAMISMKYARNLTEGKGLVWNTGESVEGYTNLLWTLYMAGLHYLPVPPSKVSLFVQLTSVAALLATLFLVRRAALMISRKSRFAMIAAVIFSAFYLPLNGWAIQGMEVGILALVLVWVILLSIRCITDGRPSAGPYLLLGISTLIRPDMVVTYVGLMSFLVWAVPHARKRHAVMGIVILAIFFGAQTVFRVAYYGHALPNTYYLKLTGYPFLLRVFRGFYVTVKFMGAANWVFFILPLVIILSNRDRALMLLGWVFLVQVLYSIYVGGDAWETWGGANRYVCIAMPVYFVLLAESLARAGAYLRERIGTGPPKARLERFVLHHPRTISVSVVIFVLLSFNSIQGPIALTEWLLIKRPLHVDRNQTMVEKALFLRTITTPDARLGLVWDGALAYFSGRDCVSILGKNDSTIARLPMRTTPLPQGLFTFLPGHLKWDYAYSIGKIKPDIVVQLWKNTEEATPYLQESYVRGTFGGFTFDFLKDSPYVRWDVLNSMIPAETSQ